MPAITIQQALQLALGQLQAGRPQEAEAICRNILTTPPAQPEAWLQLSEIYFHLGRMTEATACTQRAIQMQSHSPSACVRIGNTLMDQGRWAEAIMALEQGLKIDPNRPEIYYNLGNVYAKAAAWEKAVACYQRALDLRPDYGKAHSNMGFTLLEQHRLEEAMAHFGQQSDGADKYYNLGVALSRLGRSEEAIARYRQAIALQPEYADPLWALSWELLLLGRFAEGWQTHALHQRCSEGAIPRREFSQPLWDGSRIPGETLFLYEEQGHGDMIQFLRYLPLVRERSAGRLILECPPLLSRLMRQNGGFDDAIVDQGNSLPLPPFDRRISFLELPFALQHWEPLSVVGPYLRADPDARAVWRARLGAKAGWRVGLCWAGNPQHKNDRRRSLPPENLLPLLRTSGAHFYSLQVKPEGGQPPSLMNAGLIDLTGAIVDFADTAALIAELDLVITVDTAVAHLAGALGRPVWTLLPCVPDWRWGLERSDTPWYPTMRLFRQPAPGDWDSTIQRVRAELGTLAAPPL